MKKIFVFIVGIAVATLFLVSCSSTYNGCPAYGSVNRTRVETIH